MIACTAKWSSMVFSSGSERDSADPAPKYGPNWDMGTCPFCVGASDGGGQYALLRKYASHDWNDRFR